MQSVSIVLCTFNGARYLDEQLRSLRAQRGVIEIVAVDDRSSDDTVAILQQHAVEDARVRVWVNEDQLGVVANFERAIRLTRGQWIALSDQDDIWLPTKLARMRAAWDGEAVLVHHATRKFRGAPPRRLPARAGERRKHHGRDARRLLYRNTIVGHTTLVRADVARAAMPFPRDVPHDWWIGVGAALQGRVQYVDEFLVHYRIHDTNAYHRAGSRLRRMRSEHGLRLALLAELRARPALAGGLAEFVDDYRARLVAAETRRFSWSLAGYYWRHAALYFGDVDARIPLVKRARKSFAAACGAAGQGRGVRLVRRAGWSLAAASAAVAMVTLATWVFRADAAPREIEAGRAGSGPRVATVAATGLRASGDARGWPGRVPFYLRRLPPRPEGFARGPQAHRGVALAALPRAGGWPPAFFLPGGAGAAWPHRWHPAPPAGRLVLTAWMRPRPAGLPGRPF